MKSKTVVVHIKRGCDVNIMRPGPFGNPFVIGRDGDRLQVVQKHRAYLIRNPELQAKVRAELTGKKIGCVCAPLPCHGDNYVDLIEGKLDKEIARATKR